MDDDLFPRIPFIGAIHGFGTVPDAVPTGHSEAEEPVTVMQASGVKETPTEDQSEE